MPSTPPPREIYVTRTDFGDGWPFKAFAGTLRCHEGSSVVIEIDGVEYGLNRDARGRGEYAELDAGLLKGYPSRAKTLALIDRGLYLCDRPSM